MDGNSVNSVRTNNDASFSRISGTKNERVPKLLSLAITTSGNILEKQKGSMSKRALTHVAFLIAVAAIAGDHSASAFQQPPTTSCLPITLRGAATKIEDYRRRHFEYASPLGLVEVGKEQTVITRCVAEEEQVVPTKMLDAVQIFFFSRHHGPLWVVMSIMYFGVWRIQMSSAIEVLDALVFGATVLFWSVQEHFLHQKVLHSTQDWIGKQIHQGHHDKPYYHISIDPASLLLVWMMVAHMVLRLLLPLPLALTATLGYCLAGLFYEWAHYIVHTKVRFKSGFWKRVKDNHMRHHMVDHDYWFSFSLPWIDDLFGTNPPVKQVKRQIRMKQEQ